MLQGQYLLLSDPDFTEHYVVGENEVREQEMAAYQGNVGQLIKRLLAGLVHFHHAKINAELAGSLKLLLEEDVLTTIL